MKQRFDLTAMSSLASLTLVPFSLMMMGFFMPMFLAALSTPLAITSHLHLKH